MPSPDSEPANFFRQYISCYLQGALMNIRWPAVRYTHQDEEAFQHRGKQWAHESALYALNHNVKYFTGPSELWNDDRVLIIETVDGVNIPRTEDWLVKTLVCDWYWIYGGRAPTAAEFRAATTNKHITDGTLIEQLSALVDTFSINPTPTNRVEPRGLALSRVYPIFSDYPLVDKVLRWTDATGEHIVALPDDPSQPLIEGPAWFESSPVLTTNGLRFTLAGKTGSTHRIEFSTNLLTWRLQGDLVLTNGRAQFFDGLVTSSGQRFYRAVAR